MERGERSAVLQVHPDGADQDRGAGVLRRRDDVAQITVKVLYTPAMAGASAGTCCSRNISMPRHSCGASPAVIASQAPLRTVAPAAWS